jgi:hypothetical protein
MECLQGEFGEMIQYFFDSLMGVLLLSGLMTFVVGSCWVLVIAIKEFMGEIGWLNIGMNAQPRRRLKSNR